MNPHTLAYATKNNSVIEGFDPELVRHLKTYMNWLVQKGRARYRPFLQDHLGLHRFDRRFRTKQSAKWLQSTSEHSVLVVLRRCLRASGNRQMQGESQYNNRSEPSHTQSECECE